LRHDLTDFFDPGAYTLSMPLPLTASLVTRLERIRDMSHDLARELTRDHGETATASAMADAIKQDIDAVQRALQRPKH